MKRQLKKGIQKVFEAPKPNKREKERFLRTLPQPRISMLQFIMTQAAYLRKWALFLSILLLFPAFIGAYCIDQNTLWTVSALMPFLGLLVVAEGTRSTMYGMDEFEMSTRFSLKSIVLARMSVLGLLDFLILCCAIPLCYSSSNISILQTALYLFVPYLLTVNINLWITRHFRSKEVIYAYLSITVLVSVSNAGLHLMADFVYQLPFVKWWLILSALLAGAMIYEIYITIKQTEELSWNL